MIQYAVYTICNGGRPYHGATYYSLEECKEALLSCIEYDRKHRKSYYIDNDFYKNEFPYFTSDGFYYRIEYREVSEWDRIENMSNKNNKSHLKNNIINFPNLA